jgi:hypothetical protein
MLLLQPNRMTAAPFHIASITARSKPLRVDFCSTGRRTAAH